MRKHTILNIPKQYEKKSLLLGRHLPYVASLLVQRFLSSYGEEELVENLSDSKERALKLRQMVDKLFERKEGAGEVYNRQEEGGEKGTERWREIFKEFL